MGKDCENCDGKGYVVTEYYYTNDESWHEDCDLCNGTGLGELDPPEEDNEESNDIMDKITFDIPIGELLKGSNKKIPLVKAVREILGLCLVDAKKAVESMKISHTLFYDPDQMKMREIDKYEKMLGTGEKHR